MDSVEVGLQLLIFIIVISLFFQMIRFLVQKYLSDFYQKFAHSIRQIIRMIRRAG
ncbi:hypothetical protein PCURB6_02150 [Paenibacillus curdlanolyticus]|nr:hypothetical protein PCURB6_02150 [Paenibacillus curdlanolyticus]